MGDLKLIATSVFGVEAVVARELRMLGYYDQHTENGRTTFSGDEMAICRTNIRLRSAERVLLKIGEFRAVTFEELFQGTKALPWDEWLPENALFPVEGKSIDSKLSSVPDCQAIVKKAVVEKLKLRYGRERFEESGPKYRIEVAFLKDMATLTIDTSGTGLHKRGYRKLTTDAPLKETLASALISLSRWKSDRVLYDPFCGSGTIPVEAAMMALNIAPGLNRDFVSETWPQFSLSGKLWEKAREEAAAMALDPEAAGLRIHGSDADEEVISMARYHADQAGVGKCIHFQKMDMNKISSRYKYGFIICNPPYGERSSASDSEGGIDQLYREIGITFRKLDTWSYNIISPHTRFEVLFGRKADSRRKLYNGRIMCNYYQYYGPKPPKLL